MSSAWKSSPCEDSAVDRTISRSPVCGLDMTVPTLITRLASQHRTEHRLTDHDRVVESRRDLSGARVGISRDAQLSEWGANVEIGPLTDHAVTVELKDDDQREVDFAPRRRKAPPASKMGPGESTLDDHGPGRVMEGLGMEPEVGESSLVFLKQTVDAIAAIPHLAGGDDLVTRMRKRSDAAFEFVGVLGGHVFHD